MKSPDRDAADELIARLAESRTRIAHMCSHHHPPRMSIPADRERDDDLFICDTLDQAASELATLRRRVAEMEGDLTTQHATSLHWEERALSAEAAISAMREELLFIWKLDMPSDRNVYMQHVQAAAHRAIKASRLPSPLPPGRNAHE